MGSPTISRKMCFHAFKNDKIGNEWLFHFLKPCRFNTALKLRSNVAGNKTSAVWHEDGEGRKNKINKYATLIRLLEK